VILVDSSVWVDYFRGADNPATRRLQLALDSEPVLTGDLVLAEVLRGFRSDLEFQRARAVLESQPYIELGGMDIALKAARNYRRLRANGITISSTIDTIIATRCIEDHFKLLYCDRDFDPFVKHLGLRSALAAP
jgi:predicted nucleic acid-binding protein